MYKDRSLKFLENRIEKLKVLADQDYERFSQRLGEAIKELEDFEIRVQESKNRDLGLGLSLLYTSKMTDKYSIPTALVRHEATCTMIDCPSCFRVYPDFIASDKPVNF